MGSAQFELGEILGSHGNVKAKHLKNGGCLFCRVTTAAKVDFGTFKLQLRGHELEIAEGGVLSVGRGKVSPFFVLNAQAAHTGGNRVWHQEYRSEVIRDKDSDSDHLEWKPIDISMERLCGGDRDRAIQVEAYSWEKNGKHKILGKFQTSVNGLLAAVRMSDRGLELVHQSKPHGKIYVTQAEVVGGNVSSPSPPTHRYTTSAPPADIDSLPLPDNGAHGSAASMPPGH
ncbi:MAG: hypothetical protein SGARI_006875, partial [Bacillariaceae sp.]